MKKNKQKQKAVITILLVLCFTGIAIIREYVDRNNECPDQNKSESKWPVNRISLDSGMVNVMGTWAKLLAVGLDEDSCRSAIAIGVAELERIEDMMSWRIESSELAKVNRDAFKEPVEISVELFEVLDYAFEVSRQSGGSFDVTVGPVIDLWNNAAKSGVKPTEEEIALAKEKVGYTKIKLDSSAHTIRFMVDGMRIDLGGIAKGYAIDKATQAMISAGLLGAMVDVGGDIYCVGAPPVGRSMWKVGLQDPQDIDESHEEIILKLKLQDLSVATSGDYRRFVLIGDQKESHIINPETSHGSREFSSVSIIAPTAMQADAVATAVSVMGLEHGMALVESIEGVEAILIGSAPEYSVIKSIGADILIQK